MSVLSLSLGLLAANQDPLSRPEILWGTAGLTAAMLLGAAVIYAVDKWRKRTAEGSRDDTESLTSFRDMHEAGEITDAEYAELKRKLAEKVKKAGLPPPEQPPPNPPAPPPKPPESPPPPSTA